MNHSHKIIDTCSTKEADKCKDGCEMIGSTCRQSMLTVEWNNKNMIVASTNTDVMLDQKLCNTVSAKRSELHYADGKNVTETKSKTNVHMFGTTVQPKCTKKPPVPNGLIGLAMYNNDKIHTSSLMETLPEGQRQFTLDNTMETFCIGADCVTRPHYATINAKIPCFHSVRSPAAHVADGPLKDKTLMFSTTSTNTYDLTTAIPSLPITTYANVCTVGLYDIDYLHVDYDKNTVSYKLNDIDSVAKRCGPIKNKCIIKR